MLGDNRLENDPENKGLILTAEVLCIASMTERGGTKRRDKGRENDNT